MSKSGIYNGLPKYISKLHHTFHAYLISKAPHLLRHLNVSTAHLYLGTILHPDLRFFNKISCTKFKSSLTISDATISHLFGCPTISKCPPLQLIKTFIKFTHHHSYKCSIFRVDKSGENFQSAYSIQLCFDHDIIFKTTGGYASPINRKVELPHQIIKNMVCIQLISCGHTDNLWCFCYQYTIWLIYRLINR